MTKDTGRRSAMKMDRKCWLNRVIAVSYTHLFCVGSCGILQKFPFPDVLQDNFPDIILQQHVLR